MSLICFTYLHALMPSLAISSSARKNVFSIMRLKVLALAPLHFLQGDFSANQRHVEYYLSFPGAFVCEDGWTLSDEVCLKVVDTTVSYSDASSECAKLADGALLAAPKTEPILNSLNNLNPGGEDVWVGLDDRCKAKY